MRNHGTMLVRRLMSWSSRFPLPTSRLAPPLPFKEQRAVLKFEFSESLAYFALGAQMINSGYTITQDGKFTKPGASKREEHELWPRLWIA